MLGQGIVDLRSVDAHGQGSDWVRAYNTWLYPYGYILAKTAGLGDMDYRIRGIYVEFENVGAPGSATVSAPTINRAVTPAGSVDYYNDLSGVSDRDFLRLQLAPDPVPRPQSGYEDYFGTDEGNSVILRATTDGAVGVHGKTFSHSVYSKVFGVAIVASPDWEDRTRDIVYARAYYATNKQRLKEDGAQIELRYQLVFNAEN